MPGWQTFYHELKDKNFEILSIAQDTGGAKDAGPWIEKANPEYTALVDQEHLVTKLYGMVNVPTGVWINEQGRIVRPNEVAFVDDRFKTFTHLDSTPYLEAIRDWVAKGEKSVYAMSETQLRERLTPQSPERIHEGSAEAERQALLPGAAIAGFRQQAELTPWQPCSCRKTNTDRHISARKVLHRGML